MVEKISQGKIAKFLNDNSTKSNLDNGSKKYLIF